MDGLVEDYAHILDAEGLFACVRIGTIEFHASGSRVDDVEAPDRIIVNLEPHEQLNWGDVGRAARHLLDRLADLGLSSFAEALAIEEHPFFHTGHRSAATLRQRQGAGRVGLCQPAPAGHLNCSDVRMAFRPLVPFGDAHPRDAVPAQDHSISPPPIRQASPTMTEITRSSGSSFSDATRIVSNAIHTTFMTPATNSSAMSSQQQPTHIVP